MVGVLREELFAYTPLMSGRTTCAGRPAFLYTLSGRPLHLSNTLKRFKKALRAAGLKEVTIHSLRHTYASATLASGTFIKALQRALGYSSATMALKTCPLLQEEMGPALGRLDLLFGGHRASVTSLEDRRRGR